MKNLSRALSGILRELAQVVDSMSDDDVQRLVAGGTRIRLSLEEGDSPDVKPSKHRDARLPDETMFSDLEMELKTLTSREDGFRALARVCTTKAGLTAFARRLDLHVLRDDDVEKLRDKIVEHTIGFRLRSSAVRGRDSDGDEYK